MGARNRWSASRVVAGTTIVPGESEVCPLSDEFDVIEELELEEDCEA